MDFHTKFDQGLNYEGFLNEYATDDQRKRWDAFYESVTLSDSQKEVLSGFQREMKLLVLAGAWCGDCVNQCPIFQHFAEQNEKIRIHYFDRDDNPDLAVAVSLCGGNRVPTVVFLSEDGYFCGLYGDRTLSKYTQMPRQQLGAACPTGIVAPGDSLTERVVQEWLDEFERIQLMLRTSGRLRKLHGD